MSDAAHKLHLLRIGNIVLAAQGMSRSENHLLMCMLGLVNERGHMSTTIKDLASATGHHRNEVGRILRSWTAKGIVAETYADGRWTKGWGLAMAKDWGTDKIWTGWPQPKEPRMRAKDDTPLVPWPLDTGFDDFGKGLGPEHEWSNHSWSTQAEPKKDSAAA